MTLEKAINLLTIIDNPVGRRITPEDMNAIKLGIEALKAVKECRASHMFCPGLIMPGETEE